MAVSQGLVPSFHDGVQRGGETTRDTRPGCEKAIENGHSWLIFPLKMMIFHSYVS